MAWNTLSLECGISEILTHSAWVCGICFKRVIHVFVYDVSCGIMCYVLCVCVICVVWDSGGEREGTGASNGTGERGALKSWNGARLEAWL